MVLSLRETPVKRMIDKILNLQKRALRLIYSANRQDHAICFFVNSKVWIRLKLNARHRRKKCTDKYFELFKDIKFTSLLYTLISFIKFLHKKNLDSRVGAKIWNEMPNNFKSISKTTFRKKRKGAVLNILKNDRTVNYIDNDKIVARLKKSY